MIDHVYPKALTWSEREIKGFYQIIHAGNGEFIRARRDGMHVIIRISDNCEVGGLDVFPLVHLERKIESAAMGRIYENFKKHLPNERLVWVSKDQMILAPRQKASPGSVRAVDRFHPALENVLFDVHSHNTMDAYFSSQDDRDEGKGFRAYIVIGRVGSEMPQIQARIGCFGHFMNVPIETVADMPAGLKFEDCHESA
jgi:PRTRC genetic system protein A